MLCWVLTYRIFSVTLWSCCYSKTTLLMRKLRHHTKKLKAFAQKQAAVKRQRQNWNLGLSYSSRGVPDPGAWNWELLPSGVCPFLPIPSVQGLPPPPKVFPLPSRDPAPAQSGVKMGGPRYIFVLAPSLQPFPPSLCCLSDENKIMPHEIPLRKQDTHPRQTTLS